MATIKNGKVVSFSNTPQATDDNYSWTEDALLSLISFNATSNVLSLDVMANDLGGNAKTLYSVDDGNNYLNDLLTADVLTNGFSIWEATGGGDSVRIDHGKVDIDLTNSIRTLTGGSTNINALAAGDHIIDTFKYAIQMGSGALSWGTVTVDVRGSNDPASITGIDTGSVKEDTAGQTSTGGSLTVHDVDHGENVFQMPTSTALAGHYGNFTFDPITGVWGYALDHDLANGLAEGQIVHDYLTVKSIDATASDTINVTIAGTEDASVAKIYDLQSDWSDVTNPFGPWALLEGTNPLPHVAQLAPFFGDYSATVTQPAWEAGTALGDFLPVWFKAAAPGSVIGLDWQAGDIIMHTTDPFNGGDSGIANVQFTAPSDGTVEISGILWNAFNFHNQVQQWQLYVGDTLLDQGILAEDGTFTRDHPETFDFTNIHLSAGQTVDLAISNVTGVGDIVGVDLKISGDWAAPYTFTTIDSPLGETHVHGLNDLGETVGVIQPKTAFFTDTSDNFVTLNQPSWIDAAAFGINDAGDVVGRFGTSTGTHVFVYSNGVYTALDDPLSTLETWGQGINDAGQIVGFYTTGSTEHGFLYSGGTWTTLDDPATDHNTQLYGINDFGQIVGVYYNQDGSSHGLLYSNGSWTTLDDPLGHDTTAWGINDLGQIVGYYFDANNALHGFLYDGGVYTTIDNPLGVNGTALTGINNAGQVSGVWVGANGIQHGFIATPT